MLIRGSSDIKPSEITDHASFLSRRNYMRTAAALGLAGGLYGPELAKLATAQARTKLAGVGKSAYSVNET